MLFFLIVKSSVVEQNWLNNDWVSVLLSVFSQQFSQLKSQYLTQHLLSKLLLSLSQ